MWMPLKSFFKILSPNNNYVDILIDIAMISMIYYVTKESKNAQEKAVSFVGRIIPGKQKTLILLYIRRQIHAII